MAKFSDGCQVDIVFFDKMSGDGLAEWFEHILTEFMNIFKD